jgi:hypothetical protein
LAGRRVFRRRKKRVISAAVIQQGRATQKQGHYYCSERSDMISSPEFVRSCDPTAQIGRLPAARENPFSHRYDLLVAATASSQPPLHRDQDSRNAPRLQNLFRSPRGLGNLKTLRFNRCRTTPFGRYFPHKSYLTRARSFGAILTKRKDLDQVGTLVLGALFRSELVVTTTRKREICYEQLDSNLTTHLPHSLGWLRSYCSNCHDPP